MITCSSGFTPLSSRRCPHGAVFYAASESLEFYGYVNTSL
jgi:hypothetical protein